MSDHPHAIVTNKLGALAEKFRLPPATISALVGEFVEGVHEATFKGSPTDALLGVYHSLGPEAAWHFWGLIYRCLEDGSSKFIGDVRNDWYETAVRLDSRMDRFAHILKRWAEEKAHGSEHQRLDAEDRNENRS